MHKSFQSHSEINNSVQDIWTCYYLHDEHVNIENRLNFTQVVHQTEDGHRSKKLNGIFCQQLLEV